MRTALCPRYTLWRAVVGQLLPCIGFERVGPCDNPYFFALECSWLQPSCGSSFSALRQDSTEHLMHVTLVQRSHGLVVFLFKKTEKRLRIIVPPSRVPLRCRGQNFHGHRSTKKQVHPPSSPPSCPTPNQLARSLAATLSSLESRFSTLDDSSRPS
jgi:hypothetical protein